MALLVTFSLNGRCFTRPFMEDQLMGLLEFLELYLEKYLDANPQADKDLAYDHLPLRVLKVSTEEERSSTMENLRPGDLVFRPKKAYTTRRFSRDNSFGHLQGFITAARWLRENWQDYIAVIKRIAPGKEVELIDYDFSVPPPENDPRVPMMAPTKRR